MELDDNSLLREIQTMHERRLVCRKSIIAWYRWYSQFKTNKFPKISPERSDVELIRTIAFWMQLTDRGGSPSFPYDYLTDITFPNINPERTPRESIFFPIGAMLIILGLIAIFFIWQIGLIFILSGPFILIIGYMLNGGSSNPDLLSKNTTLYKIEGRRVLEWVAQQSNYKSS